MEARTRVTLVVICSLVLGLGVGCGWNQMRSWQIALNEDKFTQTTKVERENAAPGAASAKEETAGTAVPARVDSEKIAANAGTTTAKQVLPAEQFFGEAQAGYTAAAQIPDICAKLFCYCGCDSTDQHQSLLDCFTSDHGADCSVCNGEAIMALAMKKDGKTLAAIQQAVDEKYEHEYPFSVPSKILQQYRATRLWKPLKDKAGSVKGTKKSMAPGDDDTAKVLPGKKIGDCCGNKHSAKS